MDVRKIRGKRWDKGISKSRRQQEWLWDRHEVMMGGSLEELEGGA